MTASGWYVLATLVTASVVLSQWYLIPLAILALLCIIVEATD